MRESLAKGLTATRRFDIDKGRTIDFMGDALRVYATPAMVLDVERTCRDMVFDHLDEGEDSVGARMEIDHLGATLLGMTVEVTATVSEVDGRRVILDAEVHDGIDLVGRARHTRFVIDKERQKQRLEKKAAAVKSASGA